VFLLGDSKKSTLKSTNSNDIVGKTEERLDLCLSAGNLAWWEMELPSGKIIFNENKVKMLGYSMDDFKDVDYTAFMDIVHPEDYDRVMKAMKDHLEGKKKLYETNYRIKAKNGTYKWFNDRGSIVNRDKKGNPISVKGVVYDITDKMRIQLELEKTNKNLERIIKDRTQEIIATNKKLNDEIIERKKAEDYSERTRQFLRDIIDSAAELVISFDMNNRISTWNKTAEHITGYKLIEIINRSVGKLEVFENQQVIEDLIKKSCEKQQIGYENIVLKTKDNDKRIIRISGTSIRGRNKECVGALFVGRDITQDMELHGKLLDGCSYLLSDKTEKAAIDLFINLILSNHTGLYITRGSPSLIESTLPKIKNLKVSLFSQEEQKNYSTISTLDSLKNEIQEFSKNKNSIILINGIHYLLTMFSFDAFLKALYQINDIIAHNKSMLFIHIDPSTIDSQQLAIFENELQILPSQKIEGIIIEDETYDILKYVYEQNQLNAVVSFKKVMSRFKIAYVTAAKKIDNLEESRLIITKKQGKLRTILITEKGKSILHKRQKI
jgi:PAS domain S-box-containing protein